MNSRTLLAIHGDAIYTSNVPPPGRSLWPRGAAMTARADGCVSKVSCRALWKRLRPDRSGLLYQSRPSK